MNQPTVMIPSNSRLVSLFRGYSRGASTMGILVGASVLVGWLLDIPFLKSVIPGLFAMKVNTALCFILAGVALGLLENEAATPPLRRIGQACAAMVSLMGLLTLSEYLFGWDLGIDQFLIEELPGAVGTSHPGRMAPNAAASFVLIGLAMLLLDVETSRGSRPAEFLAFATATISFLALAGYLFPVTSLGLDHDVSTERISTGITRLDAAADAGSAELDPQAPRRAARRHDRGRKPTRQRQHFHARLPIQEKS